MLKMLLRVLKRECMGLVNKKVSGGRKVFVMKTYFQLKCSLYRLLFFSVSPVTKYHSSMEIFLLVDFLETCKILKIST